MTDVFVEVLCYEDAPGEAPVVACGHTTARCLGLHRVAWMEGYIALDGRRLLIRFDAPDAESVRLALRNVGARVDALWPGTIDGPPVNDAGIIMQIRFAEPVSGARLRVIDDCLRAAHPDARPLRQILSLDRTRAVWLYPARGAEAIVAAQRCAAFPSLLIWACRRARWRPGHNM